jgi:hypothetical protein
MTNNLFTGEGRGPGARSASKSNGLEKLLLRSLDPGIRRGTGSAK